MLDELKKAELAYSERFSKPNETENVIRYRDDRIKGMYMHNFTFIKDHTGRSLLPEIIKEEFAIRKAEEQNFLMVVLNGTLEKDIIDRLPLKPDVNSTLYMAMEPSLGLKLPGKEGCFLRKAVCQDIIEDGRKVDILASCEHMPLDFSIDRIARKIEVYTDDSKEIDFYVCYKESTPIGNVEYAPGGSALKLEDFDILAKYQRQGFGSYVVKKLCERACQDGFKYLYVITNEDDTAKDMYKKCGMKIIGKKTELLFQIHA